MKILAGDIGGTNTRLAVFEQQGSDSAPTLVLSPTKYKNVGYASLDAIVAEFDSTCAAAHDFTDACFGVAGPVDGRSVRLTNVPAWPVIDADAIAGTLKIADPRRVNLLNDMAAHASSVPAIERFFADQITTLRAGTPREQGTRAIVMPGTGLGVGLMVWDPSTKRDRAIPTEGGHEDLAARDEEEESIVRAIRVLHAKDGLGRATREMAISGPGLRCIYAALRDPKNPTLDGVPPPEQFYEFEATDPIARATLDRFTKMLGALSANVAFGGLATGGVYLGGNICHSLRERLNSTLFTDAFEQSGPSQLRSLIVSVPVKHVLYDDTGLLGAATFAAAAAGAS